MFELSLITVFVFNNAISYSSLTVYRNNNKKRMEWKQAQWSPSSDPPKNLPLCPQLERRTEMQKINDLSRIHGARLDAHPLTQPLSHILPVSPWRFTDETQFLTSHETSNFSPPICRLPFWLLGRALILYLCKWEGKKSHPQKVKSRMKETAYQFQQPVVSTQGLRYAQWGNVWLLEPTCSF